MSTRRDLTTDPSERLRAAVRESGSPLAEVMSAAPGGCVPRGGPAPAGLAAPGPRVAAGRDGAELAVSAVLEGCLLHYGRPRAVPTPDPALALLVGDRLYA